MYVSTLFIDTGTHADRPRPGRLWLRNLYRVHQRLCMAFPSAQRGRTARDPDFLEPYDPRDFPEDRHVADQPAAAVGVDALRHVHARRDDRSGFLFRVDPLPGGNVAIPVLSAIQPDWDYAFHNAGHLLVAPPAPPHRMEISIAAGARFQFRLLANPTRRSPMSKADRLARKAEGQPINRPRRQLTWDKEQTPNEAFCAWLAQRSKDAGFNLLPGIEIPYVGYAHVRKGGSSATTQRLRAVRYEGLLEVTEPDVFRDTLISGIGPAKAFGFGLLSIAPVK